MKARIFIASLRLNSRPHSGLVAPAVAATHYEGAERSVGTPCNRV